jgi:hypothetical protein
VRPRELAERRQFDFRVVDDMRGHVFDFQAYRSTADLQHDRNRITRAEDAGAASKYKMTLRVPTLVGPGQFSDETIFGVDLDVADYPMTEPATWLISQPIPWSPHFAEGRPICIGEEFWLARRGHVTLGDLVEHVARMLNWDEKGRGLGYRGWNGAAIDYHRKHYGGRALDPSLVYPALPAWIYGAKADPLPSFEIITHQRSTMEP